MCCHQIRLSAIKNRLLWLDAHVTLAVCIWASLTYVIAITIIRTHVTSLADAQDEVQASARKAVVLSFSETKEDNIVDCFLQFIFPF
jgi:hypothetical protein